MQSTNLPLLINESIFFDYAPPPTFAGHLNRHPFRVHITSSNNNDHYIMLDALYSRSYKPNQNPSKWDFLRPEYYFLDLSSNKIEYIKTTDTSFYIDSNGNLNTISGTFIGVSGFAEFYFNDDLFNCDLAFVNSTYSTIAATLQTSAIRITDTYGDDNFYLKNYTNSNATAYQPHVFNFRAPDFINITENGVRDFINPRWLGASQNVVFTMDWYQNYPYALSSTSWIDGNSISPVNNKYNFCKQIPCLADTKPYVIGLDEGGTPITIDVSTLLLTITATSPFQMEDATYNSSNVGNEYTVTLSATDSNGYATGGYVKTKFTVPSNTNLENFSINAFTTIDPTRYRFPTQSNGLYTKIWIPNPNAGFIQVADYNGIHKSIQNYPQNFQIAQVSNFSVPVIETLDYQKDNYYTTGYHGIECVSVLPAPYYQAWAIDSEMNMLYKIGTDGTLLCSIDINQVVLQNGLTEFVTNQVSPAAITLTGNFDIWMTLYDTVSVLKFDLEGNFQFAVNPLANIPNATPNINSKWYLDNEPYGLNLETQNFVEPTSIDTDQENNVWVTYSNYASGFLIKFDPKGKILYSYNYPVCSCPQKLIVDNSDNVWVALSNNIYPSLGSLEKRTTNGTIVSAFGPIRGLNKIALDSNQNIWFTYSYSRIGVIYDFYYNTSPSTFSHTFAISTLNVLDYTNDTSVYAPTILTNPNENTDETALEGIGVDQRGNVFVLNSIENKVYVFSISGIIFKDSFYVNPKGFNFYPSLTGINTTTNIEYSQYAKSIQASGDWTGFNWLNKYEFQTPKFIITDKYVYIVTRGGILLGAIPTQFYSQETSVYGLTIGGNSSNLNFLVNPSDAYKINENFNLSDNFYDLAFTPTLNNSNFLFNKFLPSLIGDLGHEDLGVKSYEKIANFVSNTSDVDTCGIDELYSIADSINENTDDYMISYPRDVKRLMNIASINQSRLWGSTHMNQNNFSKPSNDGTLNRGDLVSNSYFVTAGTPLVLKTISLEQYRFIPTGYINGLSSYPLSSLANFLGLDQKDWNQFYEFYEFIPSTSTKYNNNVIDWNNPKTTLNQNLTSYFDWVGFEQTIDQLFSYQLYDGLGLLNNTN